ncbi:MAG: SIR2 family protein [Verrucomicrobiia bacterium]
MKACFLLGSGISKPASFPPLEKISARILSGEGILKDSEGIYREKRATDGDTFFADEELKHLLRFLHWLGVQANMRFEGTPHRANYEDLFYLASQIHDDLLDEYENPAVRPFILAALSDLWESVPENARPLIELSELAGEATNYIRDVVVAMLAKQSERTDYLKLFLDAACDSTVSELNLFTLNHDKLLEEYFHNKIGVTDGFKKENEFGIRRWSPTLFDETVPSRRVTSVRLFKLHGSINWYRFRPESSRHYVRGLNPWVEEYVGIRSKPSLSEVRDSLERRHEIIGRSLILVGTFNKMLDYTDRVFLEMHYRFIRVLDETEQLIVCGYGFGDKGVNKRITEWMCSSLSRKMLIIDPKSPGQLSQSARPSVALKIKEWKRQHRWVHWSIGLDGAEISWERIAKEFLKSL